MQPQFEKLSPEDLQGEFVYRVKKLMFGAKIELPSIELEKVREELKIIRDLLYPKEHKPLKSIE